MERRRFIRAAGLVATVFMAEGCAKAVPRLAGGRPTQSQGEPSATLVPGRLSRTGPGVGTLRLEFGERRIEGSLFGCYTDRDRHGEGVTGCVDGVFLPSTKGGGAWFPRDALVRVEDGLAASVGVTQVLPSSGGIHRVHAADGGTFELHLAPGEYRLDIGVRWSQDGDPQRTNGDGFTQIDITVA
jgi:hypothetical protein